VRARESAWTARRNRNTVSYCTSTRRRTPESVRSNPNGITDTSVPVGRRQFAFTDGPRRRAAVTGAACSDTTGMTTPPASAQPPTQPRPTVPPAVRLPAPLDLGDHPGPRRAPTHHQRPRLDLAPPPSGNRRTPPRTAQRLANPSPMPAPRQPHRPSPPRRRLPLQPASNLAVSRLAGQHLEPSFPAIDSGAPSPRRGTPASSRLPSSHGGIQQTARTRRHVRATRDRS
jgi:hypothetical protein